MLPPSSMTGSNTCRCNLGDDLAGMTLMPEPVTNARNDLATRIAYGE
jgi:hypothetical protein